MSIILNNIIIIITLFLGIYTFYFMIMGCMGFLKGKESFNCFHKNKIAIIIPARNEEIVIGNLIDSLYKQNYPKNLYDIFVVINNCTDKTKEVAVSKKVNIYECRYKIKCKGDALNEFFDYAINNLTEYDGFCIFDADNIVSNNFLFEMNKALSKGYKVAQGYRDIKNPADSIVSMWYSIYYYISNRFYNSARNKINFSAIINGSGFMVSSDFIKEQGGWNTQTVTEDIEFTAKCILAGERIKWVQNAVYYDEEPFTFMQSWKQRKRWITGLIQCMEIYSKNLLKDSVLKRNLNCFDFGMFLLNPIIQILGVVSAVLPITQFLISQLGKNNGIVRISSILNLFLLFTGAYFITTIIALLSVKLERKSYLRMINGIITFGMFMITWLPINILCMLKKQTSWDEIKHIRNIDLNEIVINKNF